MFVFPVWYLGNYIPTGVPEGGGRQTVTRAEFLHSKLVTEYMYIRSYIQGVSKLS